MNEEIEALERVAAWRLRLVDEDPGDRTSEAAARLLERLAEDLQTNDHAALWAELGAISNWLGQSDAISDFAELAESYRKSIGVTAMPATGADYLATLIALARTLF